VDIIWQIILDIGLILEKKQIKKNYQKFLMLIGLEQTKKEIFYGLVLLFFISKGFGDNSRVLKWIFERVDNENRNNNAVETPIGWVITIVH
jgi:GTP-dependent phosphoenolpyruvate carboxykinase